MKKFFARCVAGWLETGHGSICFSSRSIHSSSAALAAAELSSQFVVCGAGAGGLAVAARLARRFGEGKVTIVDPAEVIFIVERI